MSKPAKVSRQWNLLRILAARRYGATVEELVAETEMDIRTVRRDIAEMKQEFAIEEEVLRYGKKRYRLKGGEKAPTGFRLDHALALYVGRKFMEPLRGTPIGESLEEAFLNIRASLNEGAIEHVEKMTDRLYIRTVGSGEYECKAELIDVLLIAIEDCKQTLIVYQSARSTEPVEYGVYPYGMVFHRGSLYLVAFSLEHQAIRHFKINRLEEVDNSGPTFDRPEEFDLQKHLSTSFGVFQGSAVVRVVIRFQPTVERYVLESKWHSSQKLNKTADGGVIAEFELSAVEEIKAWILSFGANAEVLEPASLRESITSELRQSLDRYAIGSTTDHLAFEKNEDSGGSLRPSAHLIDA